MSAAHTTYNLTVASKLADFSTRQAITYTTRNPADAGMADRTAPVVKLTRQKIVIPSGIGLAAVLAVGKLCLSL